MDRFKKILTKTDRLPGVVSEVLEITPTSTSTRASWGRWWAWTRHHRQRAEKGQPNSAYFGLAQKVSTLQQALLRIGVTDLVDIAPSAPMCGHPV